MFSRRNKERNIELGSVRRSLSPDTKRALNMMRKVRRQRKLKRITGMQAAREARSIKGDGIDMSILSPLTAAERQTARQDYKASKAVQLGGKKMNTKKRHRLRNKKRKRKTRKKRKN